MSERAADLLKDPDKEESANSARPASAAQLADESRLPSACPAAHRQVGPRRLHFENLWTV
jgi:hypothetical protein